MRLLCKNPKKLMVAVWLLFTGGSALALELTPADIKGKESEKPVSVLQQRFFRKTFRPEVGLLEGSMLNEAYTKTETRGIRAGVFLTEWAGIEFQYIDTSVTSSDDRKALNKLRYKRVDPPEGKEDEVVTPDPEVNKIQRFTDFNGVFVPFYGKLNMLDYYIIYLDLYLTAGMSKVATDQGTKSAFEMGIGQRFYLFQSLSLRIDFRDHIFTEKRSGENTTRNAYSVDFGASYFFL